MYTLDPLTQTDIDKYLNEKLGEKRSSFLNLTIQRRFIEFNQNPYYLTRLVRFYKSDPQKFPLNKSELFDKILFEQLDNDKERYNVPELKKTLLPEAIKIAFCMTLSGKSTLSDEEVEVIIPSATDRISLKHFSVLVRNETNSGFWSFEHKNLQEYLCASLLVKKEFRDIHPIISFPFDQNKLKPNFLNTVAFLFEIIPKQSNLFKDLFYWLNMSEPELLVRFEKEQLSRNIRQGIFKAIFYHYKTKGISIRFTSNFLIEELANFIEIDESIIDFITTELKSPIPEGLSFDCLKLLSYCKKPYLFKDKLNEVIFYCLKCPDKSFLHGPCIDLASDLKFDDKIQLDAMMQTGISLDNYIVRKSIINFLSGVNYFEEYVDLILTSIPIFEIGESTISYGSKIALAAIISKFENSTSLKKLFQICISNNHYISERHHYKEFQLNLEQSKKLLNKASEIFSSDKSILRVVYRLFRSLKHEVFYEKESLKFYVDFFKKTCGLKTMFLKQYRYNKGLDFFPFAFADDETCDFLITEYINGKISDNEIIYFRNNLSWNDIKLFNSLQEKLVGLSKEKFYSEDLYIDYVLLKKNQEEKNQKMLLDRNLFIAEATAIFNVFSKESICVKDISILPKSKLNFYKYSIVFDNIKKECIDNSRTLTLNDFLERFTSEEKWNGFVIDSIYALLKDRQHLEIDQNLIQIAKDWCTQEIKQVNFQKSIIDNCDGTFTFIPLIEFIKDLFLLLDINLPDQLLIKMLPCDWNTFLSHDEKEKTIGKNILEKISDKSLLKSTLLTNINSNELSINVLCSHFLLCHTLGYTECKSQLFFTITSNRLLKPYNRITLTKYYVELEGDIQDFSSFLTIPICNGEEDVYNSWEWYLIENLRGIENEKITEILLTIIEDDEQHDANKIVACEHLIWLSNITGLKTFIKYIKKNKKLPFDYKNELLYDRIKKMPENEAIKLVLELLDYSYENGFAALTSRPESIISVINDMLFSLSSLNYKNYITIKQEIDGLIKKYDQENFINSIRVSSERLTQKFFERQNETITIAEATELYNSFQK